MTLRAVLFDLDDTLYPERQFVDGGFAAVAGFLEPQLNVSAEALGSRLLELHDRDGRGRLFDALLAEHLPAVEPPLLLACVLVYRTHTPNLEPFDDVVETLTELRAGGLRTGLVSDGMASVQRRKLDALPAVARLLDQVVMTDELGAEHWKPSPLPFRVAARLLEVEPGAAAYVANDPRKDFVGARTAGLRTIRVGRLPDEGGGTMPSFECADDADEVVARFADLPEALWR
ncbi:MAG TPA: HAD hydrolase-like protein [Candidatus Limnocylindrales bacterium]|nr:HAD hydrolase-like protein [Candidatus Limnocylindrales bacterium]